MLNFLKSKKTQPPSAEREEMFMLCEYKFSIDKSESTIEVGESQIIDLTIKASEKEFESLSESESFEFSWALYSPMFYARGLKLDKKKQFIVTNENMFDHEVALYFMEHNNVKVNISLKNDSVLIAGFADVFGKEYPIEIFVKF